MKKALLVCVALMLVSGGAYAVNYTYIGVNVGWNAKTSWDNGTGAARDYPKSGDAVLVNNGQTLNFKLDAAHSYVCGQFVMDCSTSVVQFANSGPSMTITTDATNGTNGNFLLKSGNFNQYQSAAWTLNVYGNTYLNATWQNYGNPLTLNVYGNNKYFNWAHTTSGNNSEFPMYLNIYGTGYYDNASAVMLATSYKNLAVTVQPGGSIGSNASVTGMWLVHTLTLLGTPSQRSAALPALGSAVDFKYMFAGSVTQGISSDNNVPGAIAVAGGATYPRDVYLGHGGFTPGLRPYYTAMIKGGDVVVGRDMNIGSYANYGSSDTWLSTLECGTTTSRNLTVDRDLTIDFFYPNQLTGVNYGLKANNSRVWVGRHLTLGSANSHNGVIDMGNATFYVGGNFTFTGTPTAWALSNWNAGTSTVICDGNITFGARINRSTQILKTYGNLGIALNNLTVNNIGGVNLQSGNGNGGDLKLTGNLDVENGTFAGNGRPISFNGPSHTLINKVIINPGASQYNFDDNINLLTSSTVIYLGSNITIKTGDNLNMNSGGAIYLCGFTLKADGKTYSGALTGTTWTNDSGTIYALSAPAPEPATLLLLGSSVLGCLGWMRRRRIG